MTKAAHNKIEVDMEMLRYLYEHVGLTAREAAATLEVGIGTIYNRLRVLGITKSNSESHMGQKPWNYKGRYKDSQGYILVHVPLDDKFACMGSQLNSSSGVYIREHRLFVARFMDRPLDRKEIVHHKDGDKANNTLNNLELMTQSEHMKHHLAALKAVGVEV